MKTKRKPEGYVTKIETVCILVICSVLFYICVFGCAPLTIDAGYYQTRVNERAAKAHDMFWNWPCHLYWAIEEAQEKHETEEAEDVSTTSRR